MIGSFKQRPVLTAAMPVFVFIACAVLTSTTAFKQHAAGLSPYVALDLLVTAPLVYYVLGNGTISRVAALRVFVAGTFVAGLLLPKNLPQPLGTLKTAFHFLAEATLIGFVLWRFYKARKQPSSLDFLLRARFILQQMIGHKKVADLIASELAVFYYTFYNGDKSLEPGRQFTSYKQNGIRLVLSTFLALFLVETVGMHLLLGLWNKTVAWTMTGLGLYSCLQLFAHIRALKTRPVLLTASSLVLCNGLLGGDTIIPFEQIEKVERINKTFSGKGIVKVAFIAGLEKPNTAIYLKHPAELVKPFGLARKGRIFLLAVDQQEAFFALVKTNP